MKSNKINYEIKSKNIDLIDIETGSISHITFQEAIKIAEESDLDLVEFSVKDDKSVCKIMNYGKFLYKAQKTKSSNSKKQIENKELRFNPSIGKEDYEMKIKKIKEFLIDKHKVLISIKMKGREREHSDIAKLLITKIKNDCETLINQKLSEAVSATNVKISCTLIPK